MAEPLRIALIGCGKQARKHIQGYRASGEVEILVADLEPERAQALAQEAGVAALPSVQDALDDPAVTAVDICTPTPSHAPLIREALAGGKHFFCEKPLCDSYDTAREIAAEAERRGRIGMVGFIYRFAPALEVGHRLLSRPAAGGAPPLGRPVSALFRIGGRGSHQPWKHRKAEGGGAINEMLVHMLDIAIWYFGPVRGVRLLDRRLLRPTRSIQGRTCAADAEDFVLAGFEMEAGLEVVIQADLVTPSFAQSCEVQTETGSFLGSIQPETRSYVFAAESLGAEGLAAGRTEITAAGTDLYTAMMRSFLDALRHGRPPSRCALSEAPLLHSALERLRAS